MSTQVDSDRFTGDATPIEHFEQQSIIPAIKYTDVVEDISKVPFAQDKKKTGKNYNHNRSKTISILDHHICFNRTYKRTEETATKTTGRQCPL